MTLQTEVTADTTKTQGVTLIVEKRGKQVHTHTHITVYTHLKPEGLFAAWT